jgi:hypothetical protein
MARRLAIIIGAVVILGCGTDKPPEARTEAINLGTWTQEEPNPPSHGMTFGRTRIEFFKDGTALRHQDVRDRTGQWRMEHYLHWTLVGPDRIKVEDRKRDSVSVNSLMVTADALEVGGEGWASGRFRRTTKPQ